MRSMHEGKIAHDLTNFIRNLIGELFYKMEVFL